MRIVIRPSMAADRDLDITKAVVSAVAAELWKNFGGNDVLNWMEAERQVALLLAHPERPLPGRAAEPARPKTPGRARLRTTALRPPLDEIAQPAPSR
jgi:hypothetical protein